MTNYNTFKILKNMMQVEEIIKKLSQHFGKNCKQEGINHWLFEVMTRHGRSQVVHLFYKKSHHSEIDTSRFIAVSPIGPVYRHFEYEKILRKNSELDVGAICIEDLKNDENIIIPYLTVRATHMAATIDYEEAWELIDKTGMVADKLEEEIFGKDTH